MKSRNYSLLTRVNANTNPSFGLNPEKRNINQLLDYGLILLNKPQGPSSHQVADTVKKILGLNKVGHSGTLE